MRYIIAFLALVVVPAFADSTHSTGGNSSAAATAVNSNANTAYGGAGGRGGDGGTGVGFGGSAHQSQGQSQGQHQGQKQGQSQTSVNVNDNHSSAKSSASAVQGQQQGNAQSLTINNPPQTDLTFHGKYDVANVPNVTAPNIYPTSPCMGSTSVGGSGVGFGFTLGSSWKDDDCGIRETARLFGVGTPDGLAVACQSSYAAAAPSCRKLRAAEAAANVASQGERGEQDRRRDATVRTAIQQPLNCTADPFIASRTGMAKCVN